MAAHKYIDRICLTGALFSLLLSLLFLNGQALGLQSASRVMGYESRLFDTSRVHTVDIVMDDWEAFLETCEDEEYSPCAAVIDGEAYKNVGLRAKGNSSLSTVPQLGSDRYSFKLEFDHYNTGKTYYGLDKLVLNNVIQDNTYMKDYLTYRLMGEFGVNAPLCSYVYITVNGQDWGLYLAVEGLEDGFLQRNYGQDRGALYKPDSEGFGGGGGIGSSDVKLQYIDDDPDSYVNIFDSAKTEITDGDQARLIQALKTLSKGGDVSDVLDIDQVLRYFIVHNFVVNGDSYTGSIVHNYYLYEKDGRLSMLPWDYNLAFGAFQGNSTSSAVNDPIDSPLSVTGSGDRPMADWIFSSEEYTRLYHEYFEEFLNTVDPAVIIDEAYALIAPYVEQDPTKFCATEEFDAGVEALRTFCALRTQSVSGQLAGTIPSTGTGQSADSSALVDASALTLSDMGAANSRGGFGGGQNGRGSFTGDENAQSAFGEDRGGRPDFGAGEDAQSDFTPGEDVEPPSLPDEDVAPPSLPNQGGQPVMSGRQPFGDGQRPEGVEAGNFDGFPGGGPDGQTPVDSAGQTATTLILLGVSSLVLLAGLFAAFRFKRR